MDSKIDSNNNCDNTKKMEKVVKFIKKFIIWLSIWIGVALGFGYFNSIYCDSTDGVSNSGGTNTDKQIDAVKNIVKEKSESDAFVPSVLERVEELSPLVMILNYEIILGFLILVHMSILILI